MPTWRLVVCNQNHDQIGNRAAGDRLTATLDDDQLACAALLTLAGPFTPMLFQGEEWAASTPFQFFTSHPEPELGKVTAEGRIKEFERMGWDPAVVPDPQDPATFERSRLDWSELEDFRHSRMLEVYQRLAELRRTEPDLTDPSFLSVSCTADEETRVFRMRRGSVEIVVNFGDSRRDVEVSRRAAVRHQRRARCRSRRVGLPAARGGRCAARAAARRPRGPARGPPPGRLVGLAEAVPLPPAAHRAGCPPVPVAEQLHRRGHQQRPDDGRVDEQRDQHADADHLHEHDAATGRTRRSRRPAAARRW